MAVVSAVKLETLGDRAVLATCRSELIAQQWALAVREKGWPGVQDVVVAYHSVAVHVEPGVMTVSGALKMLANIQLGEVKATPKQHVVPCCYELGEDLKMVADHLKLSTEEVISLHTSTVFTVYAIGFSPGFPYLGWLPKELQGIPRRKEPRIRVPAGSVGMVGKQTGIYPQSTPGGWALIGRTTMKLVDVEEGYFPLAVGDEVKFERVKRDEVG